MYSPGCNSKTDIYVTHRYEDDDRHMARMEDILDAAICAAGMAAQSSSSQPNIGAAWHNFSFQILLLGVIHPTW